MKAVVVAKTAAQVERDWASQFAGLDAEVKKQFLTTVPWGERVGQVFMIDPLTWDGIVKAVRSAAAAARAGGTVVIASGHGGFVQGRPDRGILIWDPSAHDVALSWQQNPGLGVFWDGDMIGYDTSSQGPSQKAVDEQNIANDTSANKQDTQWRQRRLDAFKAMGQVRDALKANRVLRISFTQCAAGNATTFIDGLAKFLGCQVASFKENTEVIDDTQYNNTVQGKSRMILEGDDGTNGQGTNVMLARAMSPNMDDSKISYVGKP